jgi:glucosyl-3-phosphoglycerate synthase
VGLAAIVVIPARDEEQHIAACLSALAAQTVPREAFETIVVIDACVDATARIAKQVGEARGLKLTLVDGPGRGAGAARRVGMNLAAARLLARGLEDGLIACTDADSRPDPDWLRCQLVHVRGGARAIAGLVELDPQESPQLPAGVLRRRERDAAQRLGRVRESDPAAAHHHFAGASMAVTAGVYQDVGGLEPVAGLEDAVFATRLTEHGISILRATDVRVRTSARAIGRTPRGLSVDLAVSTWSERRRYSAATFPPQRLRRCKGATSVVVVIPTKECAETLPAILSTAVGPLLGAGVVDEVLVVDADSTDGSAEIARAAGATVIQEDEVLREYGPAQGKGDAMWRAVSVTNADVVCFLDGDTSNPQPGHLQGLIGPLLVDRSLQLVKGAFERPLRVGGVDLPNEGGRVTELMARPLLNLHEPRLAGFAQPLAGEFAGRRPLFESIPFPVGYGVEIAVLIDALRLHGLDALAECDLGTRQNRHQPLRALGEMAYSVLAAVENRIPHRSSVMGGHYLRPWQDDTTVQIAIAERPPLVTLSEAAGARELTTPAE